MATQARPPTFIKEYSMTGCQSNRKQVMCCGVVTTDKIVDMDGIGILDKNPFVSFKPPSIR